MDESKMLTVMRPMGYSLPTQWGMINWSKWCRLETERVNSRKRNFCRVVKDDKGNMGILER